VPLTLKCIHTETEGKCKNPPITAGTYGTATRGAGLSTPGERAKIKKGEQT